MKWYIVVRDTDKGREYLCYIGTAFGSFEWLTSEPDTFPDTFSSVALAQELASKHGGYVVTLKEVTP